MMSGLMQFENVTKAAVEGLVIVKITNNSIRSRQDPESLRSLRDCDCGEPDRKAFGPWE